MINVPGLTETLKPKIWGKKLQILVKIFPKYDSFLTF